jgi:enamine deaminase RidA (YjgF/YER057c/UK114 family)
VKSFCFAAAALAFLPVGGPANSQARQQATVIMSPDKRQAAGQDELGYASAVVAGDMVYLSGVIAWKAKPDETMDASYERAFRQMGGTLTQAGVSWDDVVDMTSYHTDANAQIDTFAAVKKRYIKAPHPAWTAVQVAGLLGKDGITEIKITAKKPMAARKRK